MSEQEKALSQKDAQISLLNAKITSVQETADKDIALAVSKAAAQKEKQINEMDRQIYDLTGRIEHAKQETRLREQNIKEQYEERLRMKDEEIAYYKDFKARQSTKMIGESLEQHCETEFTSCAQPVSRMHTLKRTTMPEPAARAIIFIKKRIRTESNLFPSCLK